MRAEALTKALGGRWRGSYGTARCPSHDDAKPSLSIKDGDDGRLLLHCHAGCEFRDVLSAIRDRGVDVLSSPRRSFEPRFRTTNPARPLADLIRLIWSDAKRIEGTLAERYLRLRGITVGLPASLRFHRWLRHPSGARLPAMVGRVEHAREGVVGLHRTYLDAATSQKTDLRPDKAMLGPCKGGAVRLRDGSHGLAICEGIETGLSLAGGLEDGIAVWSALSTSGVVGLELPNRDEFGDRLLIGADGDAPGRGAAHDLADRASALGWSVEIATAPEGQDFNDLVREPRRG